MDADERERLKTAARILPELRHPRFTPLLERQGGPGSPPIMIALASDRLGAVLDRIRSFGVADVNVVLYRGEGKIAVGRFTVGGPESELPPHHSPDDELPFSLESTYGLFIESVLSQPRAVFSLQDLMPGIRFGMAVA